MDKRCSAKAREVGVATPIHGSIEISRILREIADEVDGGGHAHCTCTVIIGTAVYGLGSVHDDQAAKNVIWDCNYAIAKMMAQALQA
jgi:hypothetical protein